MKVEELKAGDLLIIDFDGEKHYDIILKIGGKGVKYLNFCKPNNTTNICRNSHSTYESNLKLDLKSFHRK